jgi:hypothetical protein
VPPNAAGRAEKLLPGGHVVACATGLGFIGSGTVLLFP